MDVQQSSLPQMCGYYSITTDREYDESASSLKYFKYPKVPLDLNVGIEDIKEKPDLYFNEKLNNLLTYIVRHKAALISCSENDKELIPSVKYITYRGVIRLIMCSPYSAEGCSIIASKYKGNIYLCQFTKPEKREADKNRSLAWKRFAHYGPKFEQYCLTDDPSKMPDTSERVDECPQFFAVFKRKLLGENFLFAGEMDGVQSDTKLDLSDPDTYENTKFVELKVTANYHRSSYVKYNFTKYKCANIWTQSWLTGVSDIYFGLRDKVGIVRQIDRYSIDEFRDYWKEAWDPVQSFKFMEKFLKLVEDKLKDVDCPDTVYEFNCDRKNISFKLHEGKTDLTILPQWYLDAVNSSN